MVNQERGSSSNCPQRKSKSNETKPPRTHRSSPVADADVLRHCDGCNTRDIPASQRLLPLENDVTAFESTGSSLIYLVSAGDDRSLKSVRRGGDTQADLLDILLAGPTEDESVAQLSTSLPPDLEILSTRSVGSVAYIDLSGAMTALSGEALLRGAAQLVLTTVELPGIEAVQLTVAGERFLGSRRMATRPQDCSVYSTSPNLRELSAELSVAAAEHLERLSKRRTFLRRCSRGQGQLFAIGPLLQRGGR